MTREISKDKSLTTKYINNIFSIKLIQVSILMIFIILLVKILNYPAETEYVLYFMMIFLIFSTFSNFFTSIFQSYEKLEYQSIASVLNSTLMLVGVLILIYYSYTLVTFTILYAFVAGLILNILYFYIL